MNSQPLPVHSPSQLLCDHISQLLSHTLRVVRQQHPGLLSKKCIHLLLTQGETGVGEKVKALLDKQADLRSLIGYLDKVLNVLFQADFKGHTIYAEFWQKLKLLVQADITSPSTPNVTGLHLLHSLSKISLGWQNQPIAALLLDAENICLPPDAEAFLAASCQYPIQLKLAFANWRRLGKRDQELHSAGYQMIHVPAGKNNADLKMTADGLMISLQNSNIREVLICSADADLTHLSNTLRGTGIVVHVVKRQGSKVTLRNLATQTEQVYSIPLALEAEAKTDDSTLASPESRVKIPSLSQLKSWLKTLIFQEYQQHPDTRLTVGYLGKIFRDRNQISVNEILKVHSGPKTLQKFLEAHEDFDLSPTPDANHLQVTLRQRSQSPEPPRAPVPATKTQILDSTSLEQAIVQLLWSLSSHESGTYIDLPLLGTSFQTEHQESIKTVLKRLNLPQSLPKFLATCRSIRLKQTNKQWQVAISYLSAA